MTKKFQIFISSTFEDLKQERDQVMKAILEIGHIPVGMEMFSAADEEQWQIIKRQIEEVDYYLVIAAHRYGSIASDGIGYTEKEYDYAKSIGIPTIGFVIKEDAQWDNNHIDKDAQKIELLRNFKGTIKSKMVNFWSNKDELNAKVIASLTKAFTSHPRDGWIRSSQSTHINPETINELSRLSSENSELRKKISELEKKDKKDEFVEILKILEHNKKNINLFSLTERKWIEQNKKSLLFIFERISEITEDEATEIEINQQIKLGIPTPDGHEIARDYPLPKNHISNWLADLSSLELMEISKKKHAVSDNNTYWTLSNKGRSLHKNLRKNKLLAALPSTEDIPSEEIIA